jgi:hypothetical protein
MSAGALSVLAEGLDDDVAGAVGLVIDGDQEGTLAAIDRIRGGYAAALLVGRLERLGRAKGFEPARHEAATALYELGRGGPDPDHAWLGDARAGVADVCRYTEELARDDLGESARQALAEFINTRARQIDVP